MKAFNGRCLCRLFWKPEAYAKWKRERAKQKPLIITEKVVLTREEKKKQREEIDNVWKDL